MKRKQRKNSTGPVTEPATNRRKPAFQMPQYWVIGLVLALTFVAFANCLGNKFAYDDDTQILSNKFIQSLKNAPKAMVTEVWYWRVEQDKNLDNTLDKTRVTTSYYRPVFTIYLMIGWKLFGNEPFGWHLANILMHLAVVYLAFLLMMKISGNQTVATIATLLFAIHPLKCESVAWISGVSDLLLALFILPSFYLYMTYREKGDKRYLAVSALLFLLAAFSKEPAVSLPIFIAAYELFVTDVNQPLKTRLLRAAGYGAMYLAIVALYFGLRQYSMGFLLGNNQSSVLSLLSIALTVPIVTWKYIGLLFVPWDLTIYHATPMVLSPIDLRFIIPFVALVGLVILLRPLWRSIPARFALLWFAIMLLPVYNFSAFNPNFMVQERYLYLPSIGFCLLIAMGLSKLSLEGILPITSRRTAQIAVVIVIALLLGGKTFAQNEVWENDMTLYRHGVDVASDQAMPHFILGYQYFKRQDWEHMVDELEIFVEMDHGKNIPAIANLATAHVLRFEATQDRAHLDRAIALCQQGLNSGQDMEDATAATMWDTLGHSYTYNTPLKNYDKALVYFSRGVALTPNNPIMNMHIGATYLQIGNVDMAFRFLQVAKNGDQPEPYKFLAYAYAMKGNMKDAIANLTKYMALEPNDVDIVKEKRDLDKWKAQLDQPQAPSQG